MRRNGKWFLLVVSAALALTFVFGASGAFAQEPETGDPIVPPLVGPGKGWGRGFHFHGPWRGADRDELLADELGISVEELEAARLAALSRALGEAVDEGRLTQEQADLIEARHALRAYIDKQALVAGVLGMTEAELEAAIEAGERLPEILETQGLDAAEFRDALQAAYEEAVEDAVADGVITEEQAEQILEAPGLGGLGRRRGFGGPRFRVPGGGSQLVPAPDAGTDL